MQVEFSEKKECTVSPTIFTECISKETQDFDITNIHPQKNLPLVEQ